MHEIRASLRSLLRSPGPTSLVVSILALGVAGSTLVFALVHALLLETLPFETAEPGERIVRIFGSDERVGNARQRLAAREVAALDEHASGLDDFVFARNTGVAITDADRPLNPLMREVSPGWLRTMGHRPTLGRLIRDEEIEAGDRVVVISWELWQESFGADPNILGRGIRLENSPWSVVGVLAPALDNPLFGPGRPAVFLPLARRDLDLEDDRLRFVAVGRTSAPDDRVRQDFERASSRLRDEDPTRPPERGFRAVEIRESVSESLRPPLVALGAAVGLVWLIAFANVAHLLLTRTLGRADDLAVRRALGARAIHVARLLLADSLVLGLAGSGLAVLLVGWILEPFVGLGPTNLPVVLLERVRLGPAIVLFAGGLAFATAFLAAIPALVRTLGSRTRLSSGTRTAGSRRTSRVRQVLVVSEIALSVALVAGAGLAIRSLAHLRALPLGFEPDRTAVFRTGARGPGLETPPEWAAFHRRVRQDVEVLPGVESVGAIQFLPMFATGTSPTGARIDGAAPESTVDVVVLRASPGYFEAFGQELLDGRGFRAGDDANGEPVAILSRRAAGLLGEEATIGNSLVLEDGRSVRIVGLAGDIRGQVESPDPPAIVFVPLSQDPTPNVSYFVRGRWSEPAELLRRIEEAVWSYRPDVPVYSFLTLPDLVRDLEWRPRFMGQLMGGFALLALVLAAAGLFAVLSESVLERRTEIGIRMALGADRRRVLVTFQSEAIRLAALGSSIGLLAALGLGHVLASELHGVRPWDPAILGGTVGVLLVTAVLAAGAPSWRAARLDPSRMLRRD